MKTNQTFPSIDRQQLSTVSGGAARVAGAKSSDLDSKLTLMLSQIGDSIKEVANSKSSGGIDPTMMMMMMMMGGGSSGGAVAAAPPPPPAPAPTYVRVNVRR